MASVNQTRPHCVNQMGKTYSKPLAARNGNGMLCVNRPTDRHYEANSRFSQFYERASRRLILKNYSVVHDSLLPTAQAHELTGHRAKQRV